MIICRRSVGPERYHSRMSLTRKNTLMILGPTASGKTTLAVALARTLGGEIVSADSRQVYRGLDLGAGKDLAEYTEGGRAVPHHLIDIVDLDREYSAFHFQRDAFAAIEDCWARDTLPMVTGGTGFYLDAVLDTQRMVEAPEAPELRATLADEDDAQLIARLTALRPEQHNTTDQTDRARLLRAIEIATYAATHPPEPAPPIDALVLGVGWPREVLRKRIAQRLHARLEAGLIDEVADLHDAGVPWERLDLLGLEYRHVAQFLRGEIRNENDLFQKLNAAIAQFAKRQDTWFRRMERRGVVIHWVPAGNLAMAQELVRQHG